MVIKNAAKPKVPKDNNDKVKRMINRASIANFIQEQNNANQVVIYSKSYCPYCRATKKLFKSMPSVQVKVIELDHELDGVLIQQVLLAQTGQRTVPNIFVNGQHIGGNDNVQQAHRDGTLDRMLTTRSAQEVDKDTTNTSLRMQLRQLIKEENKNHQVVIWSKSYCPHCRATKRLFAGETDVDVVVHEIDEMENGDILQQELESKTGQKTVPNVFINGKHVGDNSDVQELARSGSLRKLL